MRKLFVVFGLVATMMSGAVPAQVRTIDPNQAIDGDLAPSEQPRAPAQTSREPTYREPTYADPVQEQDEAAPPAQSQSEAPSDYPAPAQEARAQATTEAADTFKREDLISAGEDVFGKGAAGFGSMIERILREQGEPNAYIAGREAAGAFVIGLRYGSGVMTHKVEGQMPVYWTGPSVGFDVGGDANKVFVLVYNLYDTADLYRRFPAAEGRLYFVGGFAATYLRRGNIVLIPVRLGVGYRAGVNVGYMNFTQKSRWLPF